MLKLDEHYTLVPDSFSWILKYERQKTKTVKGEQKQVKESFQTYHANIEQALHHYSDNTLKENCESVESILKAVKDLKKQIKNLKF